ncbi:MAG TPA: GNAT family N-acetyltransferase, partial [Acidimicrobiia bacterium]|nr:GNAT family N-acetyltransferase [Acidimicrobiia bacterium]
MAFASGDEGDVVLADGGSAHLRVVRPDDLDSVQSLYEALSSESRRRRFLRPITPAHAAVQGADTDVDGHHFALVAETDGGLVGVADWYRLPDDRAEVAFTVLDREQHRGIGSLLLEHLADAAISRGITTFVASVLATNAPMLQVLTDAGYRAVWDRAHDVIEVELDLTSTDALVAAREERERRAESRSVARLLAPRSIAVVGASAQDRTIGHALVQNIVDGGFMGAVYPVNPHAMEIHGRPVWRTVAEIPGPVDVAIVAVPASAVEAVLHDCIAKHVRGVVVITSGFAEVGAGSSEAELVALARANGMRMIGPNCFGIANTRDDVRLDATFSPVAPTAGRIGFASQSGGVGIDLLSRLGERGLGVSSFVSLGNKADVSTNDLLQYWESDPDSDVVVLYVESFGNPRKFARIARRVAMVKPVVALKSGRSPAGARGTMSHTAALTSLDVAVDELFRQAGVLRVDTMEELVDTTALLAHQPLPRGRRVGVISNGGGPGILAADACVAAGLQVNELSDGLQQELRAITLPGAAVGNPVDLVAAADAATFGAAVRAVLDSGEVDALVVIYVSPLVTDPAEVELAVSEAASVTSDVAVVACFLGTQRGSGPVTSGPGGRAIPAYAFPESAAYALERAVRLAEWRASPRGAISRLPNVDVEAARAHVLGELVHMPSGGWLDLEAACDVMADVGAPTAALRRAMTADDAVAAAVELGFPVALKAGAADLVHKTDRGGVILGLADPAAVRAAFAAMLATLGTAMGGAYVQAMVPEGVELIVGVTQDPTFGPLVLLGMGGTTAELVRDTTVRLVPMTDLDAATMVRELKTSPLLTGYRGAPAVDIEALEALVLRVAALAEAVPEIAELDC